MFTLGQEHIVEEASKPQPIMFTAGAVPVRNKKGEMSMEKVHVKRYVAGKRPDWADDEMDESSDEEQSAKFVQSEMASDEEEEISAQVRYQRHRADNDVDLHNVDDRRLRRLMQRDHEDVEERIQRRRVHEPQVIAHGTDEESEEEVERPTRSATHAVALDEESSDEEELDEEEIEKRRARLRERARAKRGAEEELLAIPTDVKEEDAEKETEMEEEYISDEESEYTDSEDDDGPRLKPVFVRKKDRLTIQEREKEEERQRLLALEAKKAAEERKKYSVKLVEMEARAELEAHSAATGSLDAALGAIDSDDGNDEAEYEAWKVRELKRIKRDRDEREALEREKEEIERMRNMTEEERRAELRNNPRVVPNQAPKGKYKFLQKYYHRGAFYINEEETVLARDYTAPTLEDHFDKSILPKVMQVKNFGRSGRTKYTHLVDQDTTNYDSPWSQEVAGSNRYMSNRGGGMKQNFARPSTKKHTDT
uniref:Microfibrillar-associated protein 1-like n=1 Tax=Phallusia mammillata TaxID=59560 RepID=A0A6F9DLB3_9ASCI|nr:microfibrillar-associated protein 1-like [Phallusia mammillata]